jgi:hypothetical protein
MEPNKGAFKRIRKSSSAHQDVSQYRTSLNWHFARSGRDPNTEMHLADRSRTVLEIVLRTKQIIPDQLESALGQNGTNSPSFGKSALPLVSDACSPNRLRHRLSQTFMLTGSRRVRFL